MTNKEKQLLIKVLCAMLPYKLHCSVFRLNGDIKENDDILYGVIGDNVVTLKSDKDECLMYYQIKPYLRPLSSMTEEEKNEIKALGAEFSPIGSIRFSIEKDENDGFEYGYQWLDILDFLNKHHFDYRGLIEKGLAIEAPEWMYNTKTEQL